MLIVLLRKGYLISRYLKFRRIERIVRRVTIWKNVSIEQRVRLLRLFLFSFFFFFIFWLDTKIIDTNPNSFCNCTNLCFFLYLFIFSSFSHFFFFLSSSSCSSYLTCRFTCWAISLLYYSLISTRAKMHSLMRAMSRALINYMYRPRNHSNDN